MPDEFDRQAAADRDAAAVIAKEKELAQLAREYGQFCEYKAEDAVQAGDEEAAAVWSKASEAMRKRGEWVSHRLISSDFKPVTRHQSGTTRSMGPITKYQPLRARCGYQGKTVTLTD
ncbi:MAG: hypothetical protein ABSH35_13000 [Isosphaeraceae bacterium]